MNYSRRVLAAIIFVVVALLGWIVAGNTWVGYGFGAAAVVAVIYGFICLHLARETKADR